ncbi:YdcH family protein [Brackiella oedipodis]|uniref:YdcH family protein n=1 Tax=Brackiella oedipodis TaxID=124225 RepID=UPI0004904C9B|nr:YdcH family protein [Brackiella oedipodis]
MFHEFRDLIAELRQNDNHFAALFDKHNKLDDDIKRLSNDPVAATAEPEQIETLKKEKLALKDEIYRILQSKSKTAS